MATTAALAWWLLRPPPIEPELTLSRFTFDSGATLFGTISPDGKLVAYASDRDDEGNLDIYIQHISGGRASRITHHPADDITPRFSPDGSKIVFRSARDGGGIYVIDTLGGEERKIADRGLHPSFSPDGSLILYTVMPPFENFRLNRMYLVPSQGGDPKPIGEEFWVAPAFGLGPMPVWSPDGKFVLCNGIRLKEPNSPDWWLLPVSGGEPIRTGARAKLRSKDYSWFYPSAWSGNRIIFSAGSTTAEGASVYSVAVAPGTWQISGRARRLTSGPGVNFSVSVAADGLMGVTACKPASEICSIPLDPKTGTARGAPEHLTRDETAKGDPAISRDGSRVAWSAMTALPSVKAEVRLRNTVDGRESALSARGAPWSASLRPKLSTDGSTLSYRNLLAGSWHSFLISGQGAAREVCADCTIHCFFSDPNEAIVEYGNEIVRQNFRTATRSVLLTNKNPGPMPDLDLSPDDRWLAFVAGKPSGANAIYVAPVRDTPSPEQEWVAVAEEDCILDTPRWSADGNILYFVSWRDGRPCVWAQHLEPKTRKPVGSAFEFYHEKRARYVFGPMRWRKISVSRDRLVMLMAETTGNVWLTRLPAK